MYLANKGSALPSNPASLRFYFDIFDTGSNQGSCYTSLAMKKLGVGEAEELVHGHIAKM